MMPYMPINDGGVLKLFLMHVKLGRHQCTQDLAAVDLVSEHNFCTGSPQTCYKLDARQEGENVVNVAEKASSRYRICLTERRSS